MKKKDNTFITDDHALTYEENSFADKISKEKSICTKDIGNVKNEIDEEELKKIITALGGLLEKCGISRELITKNLEP